MNQPHERRAAEYRFAGRRRFGAPLRFILAGTACIALASCASLGHYGEKPTVVLRSFQSIPGEAGLPNFEISLGVINPNREALALHGVVYTISVQGQELVKGVGKDFPPVEGYSEATLVLVGQPNLVAGIRLLTRMMARPADSINYEFKAKLDTGGWSVPIRVKEAGEFNLAALRTEP